MLPSHLHCFVLPLVFASLSIALPFSSSLHYASVPPSLDVRQESQRDSSTAEGASLIIHGWISQPNGRGTVDIIWSCLFTIFLCSWSVLCLNVPAPKDNKWTLFRRKCYLAALGIVGPEFTLQVALGQWVSARRSVAEFRRSGFSEWTMTHAFFADMGGILLYPRGWVPFPVDAKQLHYLVINGYLPYPKLHKCSIEDKNKVEPLLRILTVGQILWFVLNCIARAAQKMEVTTLELTTNGFIFCTLATHFCWFYKPADVNVPFVLYTDTSLSDILQKAGHAAKDPYSRTPLDFVSRREWSWSLWWSFSTNMLRRMNIVFAPVERPITRVPNDHFLEIPPRIMIVLGFIDICYASLYMAGWNFWFPSNTERWFWRIATLTIMSCVLVYLVVETYTFYLIPAIKKKFFGRIGWCNNTYPQHRPMMRGRAKTGTGKLAAALRNNSLQRDPALYIPLKAVIPITLAGAIYCLARAYILIEGVLVLRALPASAFETVSWTQFLPHI